MLNSQRRAVGTMAKVRHLNSQNKTGTQSWSVDYQAGAESTGNPGYADSSTHAQLNKCPATWLIELNAIAWLFREFQFNQLGTVHINKIRIEG